MKLKVMTIVGTRPELIKLSLIIKKCDNYFEHILVHTGQNYDYELNQIFFDDLGIRKPNYFLNAAGKTPAETIGNVIHLSDSILEKEKPDALLIYGDTNSCLCVIPAKRRHIPIFHLEAGNRCFDLRVPEEINRKVVDHLSDINMVHSEHARKYLEKEGIRPETIIKTGSPMREIFKIYKNNIDQSKILLDLNLTGKSYFVASLHREENVDDDKILHQLLDTLESIVEKYKKTIIVSTHPRTQKRLDGLGGRQFNERIKFLKPLGFFDYIQLQKSSYCVVSDSGTLTEESSLLSFPGIMLRKTHERPEGMDVGTVIMSGLKVENVLNSIEMAVSMKKRDEIIDYKFEYVSDKVVKIIQSYTEYIDRFVWHKLL